MRIGAHVSIAGGICRAIGKATRIGANCAQIFLSPPQGWASPKYTPGDVACFLEERRKAGIGPIFLHTIYLVNLASSSESLRKRSVDSLVSYLNAAVELEAAGVVTHLGAGGDQPAEAAETLVAQSIREAVARSHDNVTLCLETSAGSGSTIGSSFGQIARIIQDVADRKKLALCLDTAHVFAAGYDITTKDGLERTLEEIDRYIGIKALRLVHANDSKTPLGSRVDRHENIGQGFIGEEAFRRLLHHPALREVPFIIEVPGFDQEGPDAENIAILRRLAETMRNLSPRR